MSVIDVERLLQDLSPEPSGPDLEYDAAFTEAFRSAQGKPEQQMGGVIVPGEEPHWGDVKRMASELAGRTRDVRVAVLLARALARTDGLPGLADGLGLIAGLIERQWDGVHPRLDPDDNNDPTMRVNTIAALADRDTTVKGLREIPLASSRRVGRFSLRDWEVATGAVSLPEGQSAPADQSTVEAAFLDMDVAELQTSADGARAALENLARLDNGLSDKVGAGNSADLTLLKATLQTINHLLAGQLSRRGIGEGAADGGTADVGGGMAGDGRSITGAVNTREDVIRVLDLACDYFSRHEPSSPVPLLLQRAKRLVSKNFMEIMRDLAPNGVTEAETIAGLDRE